VGSTSREVGAAEHPVSLGAKLQTICEPPAHAGPAAELLAETRRSWPAPYWSLLKTAHGTARATARRRGGVRLTTGTDTLAVWSDGRTTVLSPTRAWWSSSCCWRWLN